MQNLIYELFDYLNDVEKSYRITISNLHKQLQEENTDSDKKIRIQIEESGLENIKNLQKKMTMGKNKAYKSNLRIIAFIKKHRILALVIKNVLRKISPKKANSH